MQSVRVFTHAINMLTANPSMTFRVLLGPILLSILIAIIAATFLLGGPMEWMNEAAMEARIRTGEFNWFGFFVVILLSSICWLWGAVAWHRYALLEETPNGILPKINGDRMLAYFGKGLLIALILLFFVFVLGIVAGALSVMGAVGVIIGVALMTVIGCVVWLGLSSTLPATAIGKPEALTSAFDRLYTNLGLLIGLGFILFVTLILPSILVDLTENAGLIMIVDLVIQIIGGMIILSIMTTLYGIWFDGREV